jgi:hypothetical protein
MLQVCARSLCACLIWSALLCSALKCIGRQAVLLLLTLAAGWRVVCMRSLHCKALGYPRALPPMPYEVVRARADAYCTRGL